MCKKFFLFYLFLAFSFVVTGCDSGPTGEKKNGTVSFSVERTDSIPPNADSALVRVWKSDDQQNLDFNSTGYVEIPSVRGEKKEVTLEVPSGTDYQAGILVVETITGSREKRLRASGHSFGLSVRSGDTTNAGVEIDLLEAKLEHPSVIGEGDTLKATVTLNLPVIQITTGIGGSLSQEESFITRTGLSLPAVGEKSSTSSTVGQRLLADDILRELSPGMDTSYVKVVFDPGRGIIDWLRPIDSLNTGSFQLNPIAFPEVNRELEGKSESFPVPYRQQSPSQNQ